jgi:hypothetical protein
MEQPKMQSVDRLSRDEVVFVLFLFVLGLGFFVRNAHLELALDDIGWLKGETPTVFDQYRYIPRFFFASLYTLFGPNAIAALIMIFSFHTLNTLLVYRLCQKLTGNLAASRVAACVFMVNPITLATLTWISCFSYVLGTSLALASLLAFWKSIAEISDSPLLWWGVALACYVAALFCSHEVFFLPTLFLPLCWLAGSVSWKRVWALFAVSMGCAVLVHFTVYRFERYGVETMRLFSLDFVSALLSSVWSYGVSLGLAYPLSFLFKPTEFLRVCFSEPVRWGLTWLVLAAAVAFYRPSKTLRMWLVLAFSFAALITPYILRLCLTPESVSYDISYVLSGRVFYLPFSIVAMGLGGITWKLFQRRSTGIALLPLVVIPYLYALLILYDKTDFMGLQVLKGARQSFSPSWTPYADSHPMWFISSLLVVTTILALRFVPRRVRGSRKVRLW